MNMLVQAFNPLDYDPSQSAGSFPVGKHPVIIEGSEVKATKDNSGGYLQLNLKVYDGPLKGTTGPYRLNLYNNSAKAVEIANRQLSAICHVLQTFQLGPQGTDISVLFNKPFIIEVLPQKGDEGAQGYTEIKRVFDMNGNEPGKGGGQGAAQPQGQQQAPQGQGGGWGGQQAGQQQPPQGQGGWQQGGQQQQPAQGGWGGQQGAQQQAPQGQGQGGNGSGAAWGQGAQQAPQGGGQAWGNQGGGQQQAPQGQQGGWQQGGGAGAGGGAPWGQR